MSPYPSIVNRDMIVDKAREIIEGEGFEHLTLSILASALGIKAPSLYKHFANKATLLKEINNDTAAQLKQAMLTAASEGTPRTRLIEAASAYRTFALTHPISYTLLYANQAPESRADPQLLESLALPYQNLVAAIVGHARSLAALRGAFALLHGFVVLELNGQFQRGGNVPEAFLQSLDAYLEGWQRYHRAQ